MGFDEAKVKRALALTTNIEDAAGIVIAMGDASPEELDADGDTLANLPEPDPYKMVIVVRKDLKMKTGKIAAQVGHGVLGAYKQSISRYPEKVLEWENNGQPKIVLKVQSQEELERVRNSSQEVGVVAVCIRDAGRT